MLAGLLITVLRVRDRVPCHPLDLMSYVGGWYAYQDGQDPYQNQEARASLASRSIFVVPYDFVYSPPVLLAIGLLDLLPYRWFRLGWVGAGALCAWLSAFLLTKRLPGRERTVFALSAVLVLTASETLVDNMVFGQITAFLLLAATVPVARDFRGAASGIAASFIPLTKVGFMPLPLFLKGKRALFSLGTAVALPVLAAALCFGPGIYGQWVDRILWIGNCWSFSESNNLSVSHASCLLTETFLLRMDTGRACLDDVYRHDTADRVRRVSFGVYLIALAGVTLWLAAALCRRRRTCVPPSRETMFSISVLYLLVFIPSVWIQYGLFFLIPLRALCRRGGVVIPAVFTATVILWGSPLGALPSWPRFLVPLGWMIYMVLRRERPRSMSSLESPVFTAEAGKNSRDPQGRRSEAGAAEVR